MRFNASRESPTRPLRAIFAEACDARRHERRQKTIPNPSILGLRRFLLCAQDARCSWFPLHCGGSGRDARRSGAMDRADSAACTRMCTQRNTGELTRTFWAGARKAQCQGCAFFGLPFFAQALRRRSGANSEAGGNAAKGRMPGVKKGNSLGRWPSESFALRRSPAGRVKALLPTHSPAGRTRHPVFTHARLRTSPAPAHAAQPSPPGRLSSQATARLPPSL